MNYVQTSGKLMIHLGVSFYYALLQNCVMSLMFVISVCMSISTEELGSHWANVHQF
jgi:hypothetical protein